MKKSFIATVYNEEESISAFLKSLEKQSEVPDEVIIVDGGSKDKTVGLIESFDKSSRLNVKLLVKKGNRSVGRNEAIKNSTGDIIVCSDSGCILHKDWVKNIVKPFSDPKVDVVAGYYRGLPKSALEQALVPYVLVMEDSVNKDTFLPATRSMAFRKKPWTKIGGFNERFSNNEDFVFANQLRKAGVRIHFAKEAIVYWKPRKTLAEAFNMFYRFAKGDSESGIIRPKVVLIFLRYLAGASLAVGYLISQFYALLLLMLTGLLVYIIWAVFKNSRYVESKIAWIYLVVFQFLSDTAVIIGTVMGQFSSSRKKSPA